MKFTDIRAAQQLYYYLRHCRAQWHSQYIDVKAFVHSYKPSELPQTSAFEAQVLITAFCGESRQTFEIVKIVTLVTEMLENYGEIFKFDVVDSAAFSVTLLVEFYDLLAAEKVIEQLDLFQIGVSIAFSSRIPFHPNRGLTH